MSEVKLIFDEHMRKAVANGLRRRGVSVQTAHELGRRSFSDEMQLRLAAADDSVMVTHDDDYLSLAAEFTARGEFFAGVVF